MRVRVFTTLFVACVMLFTTTLLVIADVPEQDVLMLNSSLFQEHRMPVVAFPHTFHYDDLGLDCTECHHLYKGGKNVWDEDQPVKKCQECHTDATTKNELRLPIPKQKLNLKLAFHNNCIGCHRKYNHENHVHTAPIRCQDCHKNSQ